MASGPFAWCSWAGRWTSWFSSRRDWEFLARREFLKQVKIPPRRGIIFDRNQVELAVTLDTDSVYAQPLGISDPEATGRKLAAALDLPADKLIPRLKGEKGFVWLARRVSPDKAEAAMREDLDGVGLMSEPRRFYPFTNLACHVLGFAGLDGQGLEGLERHYDEELKGPATTITSLRDNLGRTIHLTPAAFTSLPEGRHLWLTLDKQLQYTTERVLAETVEKYRAKGGQAIVMVPTTGEVLAMASLPVFNPNVYARFPSESYRNRCVTDAFEPGSTFKLFVAAAALASHRVNLEQLFDCEGGEWGIGGRVIHDTHSYQRLNLADIIKVSSNIGAAKVGQTVGAPELARVLEDFGFGQPTGVDLPGEARGILRPVAGWRPVELANICFGQGVAVTPLQMIQAVAAIANGGVLMRPFVTRGFLDREANLVAETHPQVIRRVMGAREARLLTQMMVRVTEPGGTGTQARVEPFAVAGKTGTAQKVNPLGGYSKSDYMASFVGFLPAEDPKVAILVVVDTPQGSHYGGVVSGPAFARIARAALAAQDLHPQVPPLLKAKTAQPAAFPAPLRPAGDDPAQALAAGRAPDLRGYTLRQALALLQGHGLMVQAAGWGRVAEQEPAPGSPLAEGFSLRLKPVEGGA